MNVIKISRPEQYIQEVLAWERVLEFYKQENAMQKTRLSQVLDRHSGHDLTETAEYFNNEFIFTDEFIASLFKDIRQQKDMLEVSSEGDHSNDRLIDKYQQKLRVDMEKFEKASTTLRHAFNSRLLSFNS